MSPVLSRGFRVLGLLAAGVVGLAILAFIALLLFVDPNRFKPRIEAEAGRRLGRELTLSGDLRWRLYPWLVIESGGGALSSPPAFGGEGFARWERLRFGVRLRPLFDRRAEIDSLEIDGLQLRLIRDAQGRANWTLPPATSTAGAGSDAQVAIGIGRVALADSLVSWFDAPTGRRLRAERLTLAFSVPETATGAPVAIADLHVDARVFGGTLAGAGVAVAFDAARLVVDPARAALSLPAFAARFGPARVDGALDAAAGEAPTATGRVAVSTPSLRGLLSAAGFAAPATRDAAALGQFEFAAPLAYAAGRLSLAPLSIHLDDTRVEGELEAGPAPDRALRFQLRADALRADRYLPPADVDSEPFALPLAALKSLKARGRLVLGQLDLLGVHSTGVTVELE
jgi:AsmA protein